MEQKVEREWTSIVCPEGKEKVSVMLEWDTVTEKGHIFKESLKQIDCHNPKLMEFGEADCNWECRKVIVKRET